MAVEKSRQSPLVSIIIPTYNREEVVDQTLNSVRAQEYAHWECIVVDDGSTDKTVALVNAFCEQDERFRLVVRDRSPKGAPTCRNIGLAKAAGAFVVFLDSDDLLAQNCLSNRVDTILSFPDFDFWVFPTALFDLKPGDNPRLWNILNKEETDLIRFLLQDMPWHTMGPIWSINAIREIGGFDENAICWQDWELHVRAIIAGLRYHKSGDEQIDSYYRVNSTYTTPAISQNDNKLEHLVFRMQLFSDFFDKIRARHISYKTKEAFKVLFFRLFIELEKHRDKKRCANLLRKIRKDRLFCHFEVALLYVYSIRLRFQKAEEFKTRILNKLLYVTNKYVFFNTTNSTFHR